MRQLMLKPAGIQWYTMFDTPGNTEKHSKKKCSIVCQCCKQIQPTARLNPSKFIIIEALSLVLVSQS